MIITNPTVLPDAVAVVNPKLGTYPFPDLCGAAVAFKLAQAMLRAAHFHLLRLGKMVVGMVDIATVADMVPLWVRIVSWHTMVFRYYVNLAAQDYNSY